MSDEQKNNNGTQLLVGGVRLGASLIGAKVWLVIIAIVAILIVIALVALAAVVALSQFANTDATNASNNVSAVCTDQDEAADAVVSNGDGSSVKSPVSEYPDSVMPTAALIVKTTQDAGYSDQAATLAITVAMGESSLGSNKKAMTQANKDGDQGLYQMRVIYGDGAWYGTPEQVQDPVWSTLTWLNGTDNQYGHMTGLKDIKGWEGMSPADAIHKVQRNDPDTNYVYSNNYEKAKLIFQAVTGREVAGGTGTASVNCETDDAPVAAPGDVGSVLKFGQEYVGWDYVFGGGDGDGPGMSNIRAEDRGQTGFDCSGLTAYAYMQGAGVALPRMASDQWAAYSANSVKEADVQPGDLIFYAYGRKGGKVDHVAMYLGDGKMVEASNSAQVVRITKARMFSNDSGTKGIARIMPGGTVTGGDAK